LKNHSLAATRLFDKIALKGLPNVIVTGKHRRADAAFHGLIFHVLVELDAAVLPHQWRMRSLDIL
jgi:hypothetical protein